VLFMTMAMTTVTFAASGYLFNTGTLKLFLLGFPALLAGLWLGVAAYGKLDDAAFRKAILILLLVSGLSLVVPTSLDGLSEHRARGSTLLRPDLMLGSTEASNTSIA
jgi:hypothetical protein